MRVFVALPIPELLAQRIGLIGGGIPGARWEKPEKLHLTLRFLGDLEGAELRDVHEALSGIESPAFELTLRGTGHFPPRGQPRAIWLGVDDPTEVTALHRRIERALASVGIESDRRKFAPHVTIGRLRNAPSRKVADFLAQHALFSAEPFAVDTFVLMSSVLRPGGSAYAVQETYALGQSAMVP